MVFTFDTHPAHPSFVETIWRTHSQGAGTFTSTAATNWELVIATVDGHTTIAARGPETKASQAEFPADAEFLGITFRLGTFMPELPVSTLRDRQDAALPAASRTSFWLANSVWEVPSFDNAEVFVSRLIRQGVLVRDPVVQAARAGRTTDLSIRSLQYHFLRATGLSPKTIQQIERARRAVSLLERGVPIVEAAYALDYCDQAHLTNALKRFMGRTPAQIARKSTLA